MHLVQTAGLEPAQFTQRNPQRNPRAPLCQLSYICIPPASAGVSRKERTDGKNEDTDITPHLHSRTSVHQHSSKWRNLKYLFSVQLPLALIPAELVKADVIIRGDQFQLRKPWFPCASLVPPQCIPAQPHQLGCHIPADNRVPAFSEPLQPFRECAHILTSHSRKFSTTGPPAVSIFTLRYRPRGRIYTTSPRRIGYS